MRYALIINNDEWDEDDQDMSFEQVEYEVGELLRSGYISVEKIKEMPERLLCSEAVKELSRDD